MNINIWIFSSSIILLYYFYLSICININIYIYKYMHKYLLWSICIYNNSLTWILRPFWDDSPYKHDSRVRENSEVAIIYPDPIIYTIIIPLHTLCQHANRLPKQRSSDFYVCPCGAIYGSPHPEENARASPGLSSLGPVTASGFPHAG